MTRQPLLPVLLIVVIGSAALGMIWLTVPSDTPTPMLHDRYAESWGFGKSGEQIPLLSGLRLPARVGERRMVPDVDGPA